MAGGGVVSLDALLGNVWNSGAEVELGGGLNFTGGLTAVYNPSTRMIDITSGGPGGGGGHIIQDEGTSLAQMPILDFAGGGVSVANVGGKTVVTIPGGTLVNLPASPGDNGKVGVASGGNFAYTLLSSGHLAANAAIALSQLAQQAALTVVCNPTNGSAVPIVVAAGTANRFFGRRGTALVFDSIDAGTDITAGVLPVARGGSAPGVSGGNLTNANVSKAITDGTDFTLQTGTLAGSDKALTLATTGTPKVGEQIRVYVYAQAFNYTVQNGGTLTSSFTVAPGEKWVVIGEWMGADYLVQPGYRLA